MASDDGTEPLDEIYSETIEYNGRTYQKYALSNKVYFAPIDEGEIARLECQHAALCKSFDGRLIFPPVQSPKRILDCGCGAGDWAVDVANQYPDAEVVGVDISPRVLPEFPPSNLDPQVDDLNARFTFPPNYFDIVHSQMMFAGINSNRWRGYIRDIFGVLKPGGWCQMVEMYLNAQSDNGSLTPDNALSKWSQRYLDAVQPYKDPRAALSLATWMRRSGFVEVEARFLSLPMCGWSTVPRDRDIGSANEENVQELLYSLGLYPMTSLKGMPLAAFEQMVEQAREEARNPTLKAYFPLYVCIGKKPSS